MLWSWAGYFFNLVIKLLFVYLVEMQTIILIKLYSLLYTVIVMLLDIVISQEIQIVIRMCVASIQFKRLRICIQIGVRLKLAFLKSSNSIDVWYISW